MVRGRIHSFRYALAGLRIAIKEGVNFRLQAAAGLIALSLAALFHLSLPERALVVLTVAAVLSAEIFNTAIEELCKKWGDGHDPVLGKVKDLAAGAVLVISIGALFVGVLLVRSVFTENI